MSRKGLNLPDTDFGGDVITEKDMADIEFGATRDFDFVAMSFIQSAEDVEKLRPNSSFLTVQPHKSLQKSRLKSYRN